MSCAQPKHRDDGDNENAITQLSSARNINCSAFRLQWNLMIAMPREKHVIIIVLNFFIGFVSIQSNLQGIVISLIYTAVECFTTKRNNYMSNIEVRF